MSRLTPEEHLDAALGQLASARRAEAGPEDERAIAELERFLASVRREASAAAEPAASARVVEAVLRSSTRQDLTWRGDLHLVRGFVRRRLAQSPSLRAVAALLLLQVLLAPGVLAFLALRPAPARPEVRLGLEPPVGELDLREAEQKLSEALPLPELQETLPGGSLRAQQARAVEWLVDLELRADLGSAPAEEAGIGVALAWRSSLARPRADGGMELAPALRQRAEVDLAVRAIVLEAELDRVCRGSLLRDPEAAAQALLATAPEPASPLEVALWEAARVRARGLGLLRDAQVPGEPEGVHEAWVERVLEVARERGEPSPLL